VLTQDFLFVDGPERAAANSLQDQKEKELLWQDLSELDHREYVKAFCSGVTDLMSAQKDDTSVKSNL
jgi:hypothetical protein